MDNLLPIIISGGILLLPLLTLCWTIAWTIISSRKQAHDAKEHTQQLNQIQKDIEQSNRLHNQTVQNLYRARDAIVTMQKSYAYINVLETSHGVSISNEIGATKHAELVASYSELKGIAFAIGDEDLTKITQDFQLLNTLKDGATPREIGAEHDRIVGDTSTKLHKHITKLLEDATKI